MELIIMRKDIIINSTESETRIGILEDGQLIELFMERPEKERTVGDVYKGRVARVLPGVHAAFIDIGQKQDAFLHFSDISEYTFEFGGFDDDDDEEYTGRKTKPGRDGDNGSPQLKAGQEILVQITKEPISNKGSRVTSWISLPGRFIVLVPDDERVGVSKKISNHNEKRRLRRLAHALRPTGFGIIVRTVAEGKDAESLKADLDHLVKVWQRIKNSAEKVRAPALIHKDMAMASSVIRDLFTNDVDRVVIDSKKLHREIITYLRNVSPNLVPRVEQYRGSKPIFDAFNIEPEIEKAMERKVWLKNGGYIIIEPTEALVSIDVNSGKFVGKKDHESNSLQTNLEASREIARQLKLRDLGGLIVIDFIDMSDERNRRRVFDEFKRELSKDRAKTSITSISEFGLMEMTRQRVRPSVMTVFSEICQTCAGTGRVLSRETILNKINRWFKRFRASSKDRRLKLTVRPDIAEYIRSKKILWKLELKYLTLIELVSDENIKHDEFFFYSKSRKKDITEEYKA
jgi:ribonuclease G